MSKRKTVQVGSIVEFQAESVFTARVIGFEGKNLILRVNEWVSENNIFQIPQNSPFIRY